jgi:hypothetical protein
MLMMKGNNEGSKRKTWQPTSDVGKGKGSKGKKGNPSK